MKGLNFSGRAFFSLICSLTFLLLAPYKEVSSADRSTVLQTLNGKVVVKLEPHGSIRAKVFKGQNLQYEFILDRETQQKLLVQSIDRANIYLVGQHGEELVIDDLKTQKRYILSMFGGTNKLINVPSARSQVTIIKGYSVSLLQ